MSTRPRIIETHLGALRARVVDTAQAPDERPTVVVVLCHGYGAPGDDLVPLAMEVLAARPELVGVARFVFPEAPLPCLANPFGGRAWWEIDVGAYDASMRSGKYREMAKQTPDGMVDARRKLHSLVDEALAQANLPMSRLVLGGFSQGAMLTTDLALRLEEAPAALAVLSGTLLSEDDWRRRAPQRKGLSVVMSHGRRDPILPFFGAEVLRDLLVEAGLEVDFIPFDGPHTIEATALDRLGEVIAAVAARDEV